MKNTYYILSDLEGYGSAYPICVGRYEAERLLAEWGYESEQFDEIWREADDSDIAEYGVEEQTWYAIEADEDDNDWGTGSYDYDEAVRMLREIAGDHPDARIAVIRIDQYDSVCDRVIIPDYDTMTEIEYVKQ